MNKADPPRSFGVFKPVGHTLVVFRDRQAMDAATGELERAGLSDSGVTSYTPQEMLAQTEQDLHGASALAAIGQELNLVKVHHDLAQQGCHFLVVPTDDDEIAHKVGDIVRQHGALAAQHYGRFMVEELVGPDEGQRQLFESPDRGLDTKLPVSKPQP